METDIPNLPGVYIVTHEPTGLYYVGSSGNLLERRHHHVAGLRNGNHISPRLQQTWQGEISEYTFKFETCIDRDSAYDREQELLDKLWGMPLCTNHGNSARSRWVIGTEPKEYLDRLYRNMDLGRQNRIYVSGFRHTEEAKERMRQAQALRPSDSYRRGHTLSDEARAKLSDFQKNRPRAQGLIFTDEHKANMKLSAIARGEKRSRKVSIDGVLYTNAAYAAEAHNVTRRTVVLRIQSERPEFSGWKYANS